MIVNETGDYTNSNQLKIFQEISTSKFQRQHAAKCRYDGLCSATKTEIHCGCFWRNFITITFENNFRGRGGGAASEKKAEEEKDAQ